MSLESSLSIHDLAPSYDGHVGPVARGMIYGWVVDLGDPDRHVEFILLIDGGDVGRFRADRFLPKLAGRHFGDGMHGFAVAVDPRWTSTKPRRIEICPVGGEILSQHVISTLSPPQQAPSPAALDGSHAEALTIDLLTSAERRTGLRQRAGTASRSRPLERMARKTVGRAEIKRLADTIRLLGAILESDGSFADSWDGGRSQTMAHDAARAMLDAVEEAILAPMARNLFKERQWAGLSALADMVMPRSQQQFRLRLLVARGLIYDRKPNDAAAILTTYLRHRPNDDQWQFYAAMVLIRINQLEEALPPLRRAVELKPDTANYRHELSGLLRRRAILPSTPPALRTELLQESAREAEVVALTYPAKAAESWNIAARCLYELKRYPEALERADKAVEEKPGVASSLFSKCQILIALNRIAEALRLAKEVLTIDPNHEGAQFQLRTLSSLVDEDEAALESVAVVVAGEEPDATVRVDGEVRPKRYATLSALTRDVTVGWMAFAGPPGAPASTVLAAAARRAPSWCGRVLLQDASGATVELWRISLLQGLATSGYPDELSGMSERLSELGSLAATFDARSSFAWRPSVDAGRGRGTVICMSRHGVVRYGGGEQFLQSMAEHYESRGFDVLVVGTRPERVGETGTQDGRRYTFVAPRPSALRELFLQEQPTFVHVLSGLGFETAQALEGLSIPFVYGVHFWRDCLGARENENVFFTDLDRGPIPRETFRYVIERAATIYSNSNYTQAVLEEAFGIRTPILYSLPNDEPPADDEALAAKVTHGLKDYVLLLNAKTDKGFDLIIQTARLVPEVPFLVVASQSDRESAEARAHGAGASNVTVVDRTDRPDLLYRSALAVAVPSYKFIETFSRVCIEAQRFGRPVLGSDKGNVPFLLKECGAVLPEDPVAWAEEIGKLWSEPGYRASQEGKAVANSQKYSFDLQRRGVHGVVSTLEDRILVGVGAGVGNILHVGPMLRNIAQRLGRTVDVVVAQDHSDSLFLLHQPGVVNSVFSLNRQVMRRYYDLVFITHCFGDMRPPFDAKRVVYSRDWQKFEPGGPLHETVFNLAAAKELLGIEYDEADICAHYIGGITYQPPTGGRRVGFHGGSKNGFWASKRWPHYTELAGRLAARGWECASFGIAEEMVEGTLDMTGGGIAEMAEAMCSCSYFVTNDSGVMNIANGLGIPLTALFGPTNPATRGPLRPTSTMISVTTECSPCEVNPAGRSIFRAGNCRCIASIDAEQVERHVVSEMERLGLHAGS